MMTYLKTKTEKCNVLPIGRMGEGANELCVGVGWQVTLREDKEFASFQRLLARGFLAPILFVHLHILGPQNDHTDFKLL